MASPDDPKLDALLREMAPDAPSGFADSVVAATRARRRERRYARIALAAVALVALCPLLRLALVEPGRRTEGEEARRIAEQELAQPSGPEPQAGESESFAVRLPAAEEAEHRVMMARINGKVVLFARPNDQMADELEELLRLPVSMAGSVSTGKPGPSVAIRVE